YTTAANLAQAEQLQEPNEKENALKNVLTEKPDYFQARLALAKFYYENDNYQLCQETLMPVLAQPENKLYFPAAKISAAVLYEQKNYAQANELYQALWKQSCSYVYKYQLAYKIAGCNYYLGDKQEALKWYKEFLDSNFEPRQNPEAVSHAQNYIEAYDKTKRKRG
ncbi:MAG: tetratricopeptide repeat protein, partial [Phycisphaerae bacterium]